VLAGPVHPYRGGIAHHTALLARALESAGHVTQVVTFRSQYPGWLFPGRSDRDASARPLEFPARACLRPLWPPTWSAAARSGQAPRADLAIIQWWVPFFAPMSAGLTAAFRSQGAPVAMICHNVLPHDGGSATDRMLVRLGVGRADAWIVHSRSDEHRLAQLLGQRRTDRRTCRAALPPYSLGEPEPTGALAGARAAAAWRARSGIPPDARLALFFGFVRPYKGLTTLVDALPAAIAGVPDLHVAAVGEFWEPAEKHARRARELGVADRLHLQDGYVPNEDVTAVLDAADVVVLPYREATQSAVAAMALGRGVPVIATRVGGLPDAVREGADGLLVPPADETALAAAIVAYFNEPGLAEHLRRGAAERGGRPGWGDVVDLLVSLASELAE